MTIRARGMIIRCGTQASRRTIARSSAAMNAARRAAASGPSIRAASVGKTEARLNAVQRSAQACASPSAATER